jgi:hypothetical protein
MANWRMQVILWDLLFTDSPSLGAIQASASSREISTEVTPLSVANLQNRDKHLGSYSYLKPQLLLYCMKSSAAWANGPVITGGFLLLDITPSPPMHIS